MESRERRFRFSEEFLRCDSFDAMVSRRAYKEKLSVEYAIGELENGKGTQFDPDVAQAFIELVEEDPSFIKR